MTRTIAVIPARWASTRFPGKMLAPLCGKPLILWVVDRVRQARSPQEILVATDDERIASAVKAHGSVAVFTRPDHPSGTDRIAEAVQDRDADIVINVQGDEPLMDPGLIDALAAVLNADAGWDMATAAVPIRDEADVANPSVVKVVRDAEDRALYFSRSPIPHIRDKDRDTALSGGLYWRHIGIYGYRRAFLERMVRAPVAPLEEAEKLEQLRALHMGARIKVLSAVRAGIGVDDPADVPRAEQAIREAGLA